MSYFCKNTVRKLYPVLKAFSKEVTMTTSLEFYKTRSYFHDLHVLTVAAYMCKYKCNFYRKDNLTNKSWSRCLTCPRLDLWPFLDEEDEVDGASSSPTGSVRVAEVGSLMTHWISCRARAVTIWMDSSEFNLHHREIQTCIHRYMYSLIYMHIQKIPQWTHEIHRKNRFTDLYHFSFSDSCEQYEMITKAQGLWFDTKHRNHNIMYIYLRKIWNLQKEMAREPSHWVLNVSIVVTCNS